MNDEERWDIIEYLKILAVSADDPVCPGRKLSGADRAASRPGEDRRGAEMRCLRSPSSALRGYIVLLCLAIFLLGLPARHGAGGRTHRRTGHRTEEII